MNNTDRQILEKISKSNILNDVLVENEFHKRNLKLKEIANVTLVFDSEGLVHCHGYYTTKSHSCEIAIKKLLLRQNILGM